MLVCKFRILTVRELRSSGWYARWWVTSWCATEKEIYTLVKNFMRLSILTKWLTSQQFYSANRNFQQLYVFAMNSKASPPSTNTTKKCKALFPYFPWLKSRLAGEHTVVCYLSPLCIIVFAIKIGCLCDINLRIWPIYFLTQNIHFYLFCLPSANHLMLAKATGVP
jgi:hypothetical protein